MAKQSQKATSPAFAVYASDLMANRAYRLMTLTERGLLLSIMCETWVNGSVPADPDDLAQLLGQSQEAVKIALTDRVKAHLDERNSEFTCPEIEAYRARIENRRQVMSKAGKKGAKAKWGKPSEGMATPLATPLATPMASEQNRTELNRTEKTRFTKGGTIPSSPASDVDTWRASYDQAEAEQLRGKR